MFKKCFMVFAMVMAVGSISAQSLEDSKASAERVGKLQKLVGDYKASGVSGVDGYGNSVKDAAVLAIANSEQLDNLYKRDIKQEDDGTYTVSNTTPNLEDWLSLGTTLTAEGAAIAEAAKSAQTAANEAKSIVESATSEKNPMKKAKAAKSATLVKSVVEFGSSATPILLEENAYKVKAVQNIISLLKSNSNL